MWTRAQLVETVFLWHIAGLLFFFLLESRWMYCICFIKTSWMVATALKMVTIFLKAKSICQPRHPAASCSGFWGSGTSKPTSKRCWVKIMGPQPIQLRPKVFRDRPTEWWRSYGHGSFARLALLPILCAAVGVKMCRYRRFGSWTWVKYDEKMYLQALQVPEIPAFALTWWPLYQQPPYQSHFFKQKVKRYLLSFRRRPRKFEVHSFPICFCFSLRWTQRQLTGRPGRTTPPTSSQSSPWPLNFWGFCCCKMRNFGKIIVKLNETWCCCMLLFQK